LDPAPVAVPPADGSADGGPAADTASVVQGLARETGGAAVAAGQDLGSALRGVSRDLDSYYVLTFRTSSQPDGRFHPLELTSTRRDVQVRTRAGYWAPMPSELRTASAISRLSALPPVSTRALKRSPLIDSWLGLIAAPDGKRRVLFTWTPAVLPVQARRPGGRPDVVALKVTTPSGTVLYEGEVGPANAGGPGLRSNLAAFDTTPGRLQLDLTILQADGTKLDVGALDYDVPAVRGATPVILPPQLFRAQSAREFRELSANANAAPLPAREFRRTEWLLLRVPTFDPGGNAVQVSARLINRVGASVADLVAMPPGNGAGLAQFDLSLARFAPGEYSIEIAAQSSGGLARELIRFKITG
jgi:hypothetical protein